MGKFWSRRCVTGYKRCIGSISGRALELLLAKPVHS